MYVNKKNLAAFVYSLGRVWERVAEVCGLLNTYTTFYVMFTRIPPFGTWFAISEILSKRRFSHWLVFIVSAVSNINLNPIHVKSRKADIE